MHIQVPKNVDFAFFPMALAPAELLPALEGPSVATNQLFRTRQNNKESHKQQQHVQACKIPGFPIRTTGGRHAIQRS